MQPDLSKEIGVLEGQQRALSDYMGRMETRFDERLNRMESKLSGDIGDLHKKIDALITTLNHNNVRSSELSGRVRAYGVAVAGSSGLTGLIAYIIHLLTGAPIGSP